MFIIANAIDAIAMLIGTLARLYVWILLGAVICSWVEADPRNPVVRFLRQATNPVLVTIGRFVPPMGGLDFSPFLAILILQIGVEGFLVPSLMDLARAIR